jgi:PAS domain S-box-containing protein
MDLTSPSSQQPSSPSSHSPSTAAAADATAPNAQLTATEYRLLVEHSPVMIWRADRDKKCDYFNRVWLDFTGRTMMQESGDGWAEGVHPEDLDRCFKIYTSSFHRRLPFEMEYRLRRRDGVYRWLFDRGVPYTDDAGDFLGYIGSCVDVSDRKEADERRRKSEDQFRLLVQQVNDYAILLLDPDGRVATWNDGARKIKGYSADEILGRSFETFYPPEAVASGFPRYELEVAARDGRFEDEGWRVRKDGSRFWANVVITAIRDATGSLVGYAKVTRDLTARREAEERRRELAAEQAAHAAAAKKSAELEQLNHRLEEALADAERAGAATKEAYREREALLDRERDARADAERATRVRDEVLAILAHDLRNPLQAVLGAASMLALSAEQDKRQRQFNVIERAVRGMERLVTDLLDVARIESGTFAIRKERLDTSTLLHEAVELCGPQSLAMQVAVAAEVPDDVKPMHADRDRLLQVLSNLLGNAMKFSEAGTKVVVRAANTDGAVQVSVKDAGRGISEDDLPYIFDRFWQANRTSRAGAGLGLAICKGIVEAHGGRIWAASTLGRGTTFHFEIREHLPSAGSGA